MIKYFQRAFKITNENIILTTPMVLFLFLLSIYMGIAKNAPTSLFSSILLLLTIVLMISAFFAGWFYMVKKAVDLDKNVLIVDEEKSKASFQLLKEIPVGIGEYFLSFIGAFILYCGLILGVMLLTYAVGIHFIGKIGLSLEQLRLAMTSSAAMKALVKSMPMDELARLNAWNILVLIVSVVFSFITMLWPVQIIKDTKNPLIAFFKSIQSIFKNPLGAIILFVYISFVNFIVSFLNAISTLNPILYFFSMLIYFYFLVYIVVLVFLYYDREIEAKNNSNSGSDSIGQDQTVDRDSKED